MPKTKSVKKNDEKDDDDETSLPGDRPFKTLDYWRAHAFHYYMDHVAPRGDAEDAWTEEDWAELKVPMNAAFKNGQTPVDFIDQKFRLG